MINWFLNLFRKNKVYTFKPHHDSSGPHVALREFMGYKNDFERMSKRKIRLVKAYNVFGFERIDYVVEEE